MALRRMTVQFQPGHSREIGLVGEIDRCPWCRRHLIPRLVAGFGWSYGTPVPGIDEVYQCTNNACGRAFIASYDPAGNDYSLSAITPKELEPPTIPAGIANLSPTFVETYSQALVAETLNLTQLTGLGLRKALEFLIKDFACTEYPGDKEEISRKQLGPCIENYIAEPTVKQVAARAAWLGNDETHYVRRWEDKDVNDLKVLIRLVVNGIDNILVTKKYLAEMPEGRR